jgi:hypothetical protein
MFIPVQISSKSHLDLRLSIPTGFDYEITWKKASEGVIFLDEKKIVLPREEDNSILNLTYKKCSKYFLQDSGMEIKIHSYSIKYPEHIAAAIIIKETAKKFHYPDEWAIGVFEKIFTGNIFDHAASYIYAILKENEGEYFFNEIDHSLQYAQLLKDQGKLIIRVDKPFEIKTNEVKKERLLQILDKSHRINWITFLHDMHMMTDQKKLNNFLEDLRANELTTLVLPATDGWNYLIIVYFYQHKSKGMQAIIEGLYQKYLGEAPVFIG